MKKKNSLIWITCLMLLTMLVMVWPVTAQEIMVSNVFDNTYLLDALRDISTQTKVPIIADATVNGQITLTLENLSLEQALERVLAPGGFAYRKLDGYYLVGAPDNSNPSFSLLSRTEIVKLRYTNAENTVRMLADSLGTFVKADRDSNSLIITAPDRIINRIKSDIEIIDQPVRQIMLEALVVDVSKSGRKELGLDWWEWSQKTTGIGNVDTVQLKDFAFNFAHITGGGLNSLLLVLKASVEKGDARIDANPRVTTLDGQVAEIFIGRERYFLLVNEKTTEGTVTSSQLQSIKAGISLKMQPQIADNGEITIKIAPEVSDVVTDDGGSEGLPIISRRSVNSTVRVKDGESIILGGLIQRVRQKIKTRVPILGYIPLLDIFFSKTQTVEEEDEVLIIITPRILENGTALDEATKTRMGIDGEN